MAIVTDAVRNKVAFYHTRDLLLFKERDNLVHLFGVDPLPGAPKCVSVRYRTRTHHGCVKFYDDGVRMENDFQLLARRPGRSAAHQPTGPASATRPPALPCRAAGRSAVGLSVDVSEQLRGWWT